MPGKEDMIPDILEQLESLAERQYEEMLQPDGTLKCSCGRCFNPLNEGGILTGNPYSMPVCGQCFIF